METSGEKKKTIIHGIAYGLIPHIGCIAFILFSVLGVTAATSLFKPLLLNAYFFYILVLISFIFATLSAIIYLKRNGILSFAGARRKWKYTLTMYGATIAVNLLLFMFVFPMAANLGDQKITGLASRDTASLALEVAIPCPGHAQLIIDELKALGGVADVRFNFPNIFYVTYEPSKTSEQQILSLAVFKTYKAKVIKY